MKDLLQNRSIELAEKVFQSRISAANELLKREDSFLNRNCPVCDSDAGNDYQVFGYTMRICDTCLTHYLHLCPAPDDLASYYNDPRISELNRKIWRRDRTKEFESKLEIIKV